MSGSVHIPLPNGVNGPSWRSKDTDKEEAPDGSVYWSVD